MIPGEVTCPSSWTTEYVGYLMTDSHSHSRNAVYECVDEAPEAVPNSGSNTDGAMFYHVGAACNVGLPCPPFVTNKPIMCVVCTK